jgi:hypothetical protein
MYALILVVVGALAAFTLFSRRKGKAAPPKQEAKLSSAPSSPAPLSVPAPPSSPVYVLDEWHVAPPVSAVVSAPSAPALAISWDDEMAASLEALRHAVREKAKADAKPLQDEISDAQSRLNAVRATAEKLGISQAATAIAEEMRHWHSWSKNPQFRFEKNLVAGLSYTGGEHIRQDRNETNINEFVFRDHQYRLLIAGEHIGYDSTDKYADLILETFEEIGWKRVFSAEVTKDISYDFAVWHVLNVTMLDAGEWIHNVVMLHELFRVKQEQTSLQRKAEYLLPKAKNI